MGTEEVLNTEKRLARCQKLDPCQVKSQRLSSAHLFQSLTHFRQGFVFREPVEDSQLVIVTRRVLI
jgi:hypothetical protein